MSYSKYLDSVKKRYGPESEAGAVLKALDVEPQVIDVISTGSLQIDRVTGHGGIPRGRITQVFGPFGSGKSTTAFSTMREAQRMGLRVAYIDTEFAMYQPWLVQQGVDVSEEKFLYVSAETGEVVLDIAEDLVRSEFFGLVVIDSIAGLTSHKEIAAKSVSDQIMGGRAGLITRFINRVKAPLERANCALLCNNQLKEKVGVVYGDPRYRPGGKSLDYHASLILEVKKGDKIEQGKETIGFVLRVSPFKNRFGPVNKNLEVEVPVYNIGGVSREHDALKEGVFRGVIDRRGSSYYLGDERIGIGEDATVATLKADPDKLEAVIAAVRAA